MRGQAREGHIGTFAAYVHHFLVLFSLRMRGVERWREGVVGGER